MDGECLDLYKDRTQSLHAGDDSGTGCLTYAVTKQVFRRVFNPFEALPLHDEESGLCGGAETVLHRPQHTELIATVAFQVEDHVDHVLQDARPREISFLRHVTDDHDRDILTFREAHEYGGAVADLCGTSHRGFIGRKIHRLDGVDDQHGWLFFFCLRDDGIQIAAGIDEHIVISSAEPLSTHLDLRLGLFPACIKDAPPRLCHGVADLENQCRLADPRLSAPKDDGAGYDAASERTIDLGHRKLHAFMVFQIHFREFLRTLAADHLMRRPQLLGKDFLHRLLECIP